MASGWARGSGVESRGETRWARGSGVSESSCLFIFWLDCAERLFVRLFARLFARLFILQCRWCATGVCAIVYTNIEIAAPAARKLFVQLFLGECLCLRCFGGADPLKCKLALLGAALLIDLKFRGFLSLRIGGIVCTFHGSQSWGCLLGWAPSAGT